MTRLLRIALYALTVLLLAPAMAGLIDAWCWTILGHQVTWIDWDSEPRAITAIILAVAGGAGILPHVLFWED